MSSAVTGGEDRRRICMIWNRRSARRTLVAPADRMVSAGCVYTDFHGARQSLSPLTKPGALHVITLYHAPQSRSSRMIWLLEELGVPYEIRPVSIFRPVTGEG